MNLKALLGILAVAQSTAGYLWLGTDDGVVVREGNTLVPFDGPPAGPNVRRIVEDDDGTIWFCCDNWQRPDVAIGLSSYRNGWWRTWRADALPSA